MTLCEAWQLILTELYMSLTRGCYNRWLAGSVVVSVSEGVARIAVFDDYAVQWLSERLYPTVARVALPIFQDYGFPVDHLVFQRRA